MISKWPCLSRTLEEYLEKESFRTLARTRANMNKEEYPTNLVLGARKLGISLQIVQKRRRKTRVPKKAHL